MHLLDCKGVAGIVFGSLLCYMITLNSLGNNIAQRLSRINGERLIWQSNHPGEIRLPRIGQNHLRKDGWGDLHGVAFKAAITRNASGFFKHIAEQFLVLQTAEEQCMLRLVTSLHDMYGLMWGRPRFLTQGDLDSLKRVCIEFGEDYMRCREHARLRGDLLFNVTGKVHKVQHLPAMANIMNPAWVACYAEESLVGTTARVWKQSMHGRYTRMVQHRVLIKRLCGLLIRLEGL